MLEHLIAFYFATATNLRWELMVIKTYKLETFKGESYE